MTRRQAAVEQKWRMNRKHGILPTTYTSNAFGCFVAIKAATIGRIDLMKAAENCKTF